MRDAAQLTFVPGDPAPGAGAFALWSVPNDDQPDDHLDDAAHALGLPVGAAMSLPVVVAGEGELVSVEVEAYRVPVLAAVRRLAAMPTSADWHDWTRPSASVLAWSVAAKLGLELVAAGQIAPRLSPGRDAGQVVAVWRIAAAGDDRVARLARSMPFAGRALRRRTGQLWSADELLQAFLDALADACARAGNVPRIDPRRRGPRRELPQMLIAALTGVDPVVGHVRDVEALVGEFDDWVDPLVAQVDSKRAHLALRLRQPDDDASPWLLELQIASASDTSVRVPASAIWQPGSLTLGDEPLVDAEGTLARALADAARLFAPLDRALSEQRPSFVELDADETAELIDHGIERLAARGVVVDIPPQLRADTLPRLGLRLRVGSDVPTAAAPDAPLGLRAITDTALELVAGDTTIDHDEFVAIVATRAPLVRWRGRWIRVPAEVGAYVDVAGDGVALSLTEALAAALSGRHRVRDVGWVDVRTQGAARRLITRIQKGVEVSDAVVEHFAGTLRPYQLRGVAWLQHLLELGLGGVLADEMGLGKTVQAIAVMAARRGGAPHLVVCPTSVVGNWERELTRFAPSLDVIRHHGGDRQRRRSVLTGADVVVTSYALLRRDVDLLASVDWDIVVFDEAQQIKNASAQAARAARRLSSTARIAMTGTPVENRLAELWSIIDLTNPGLVGTQRRFEERFAVPIERWRDQDATTRLRRLTAPFVLRRRKADDEVAIDLPAKQEVEVVCRLTREQVALYRRVVDEAFGGRGLGVTAFERRGRVLALLTALKQICNHPAQYLGEPGPIEGRSGKVDRLTEILAEIVDGGAYAVVFTQYRALGDLLVEHLPGALGLPQLPFLHGGVPLAGRDAMVDRFQHDVDAPPLLLVSLRAGGVGLNLTRATHVVHVDRWWNPAVEDQATDRAHRIGQRKPVTVHTMVTAGTVEERISSLLASKRQLADLAVGDGESWVSDLADDELHELVELGREAGTGDHDDPEEIADEPRAQLTVVPPVTR